MGDGTVLLIKANSLHQYYLLTVGLLKNKAGGGQQKYQGQILVGLKGLQWHKAGSHWYWK